jgi:hypothetical protein
MDDKVFQAALIELLRSMGEFAQRAGHTNLKVADLVPTLWQQALTPETPLTPVVDEAARLAAGGRGEIRDTPPLKALQSIFVSLGSRQVEYSPQRYVPLVPLMLPLKKDSIFPVAEISATVAAYKDLWNAFAMAAQRLREQPWTEAIGLLDLMQRYTWCLPATIYNGGAEVSLYDQSRGEHQYWWPWWSYSRLWSIVCDQSDRSGRSGWETAGDRHSDRVRAQTRSFWSERCI